jgi:hypothetical protein
VDAIRSNAPNAEIFCISQTFTLNPSNTAINVSIEDYRQVVYDAVTNRINAGDGKIHLIKGEEITDSSYLNDDVHLNIDGAKWFANDLFTQMDPIVNPTNQPPYWNWDPFTQATLDADSNYVKWISYRYDDDDGDALTLAKVSGPTWLTIGNSATGKIQGTPTNADAGTNTFILSVSDGKAAPVEATMYIIVKSYYEGWQEGYGLSGADADMTADPDGDGINNLAEYAIGGNPTNAADSGTGFPHLMKPNATSGSILFVYPRRNDASGRDLVYSLQFSTNITASVPVWTNGTYQETGTAPLDSEFDAVTNQIPTDQMDFQYFRLRVEQQ